MIGAVGVKRFANAILAHGKPAQYAAGRPIGPT
jgi:hypothetical protein